MAEKMLPLSGYKVVELSTIVAGPVTARLFSDFGADVIKVEALQGDPLRPHGTAHGLPAETDHNPLFDMYNGGKKFVALNLKTESGMEVFLKLLSDADIFITNIRMQSLVKMGIDYDSLAKKYPKLIYGHFSGFGIKGPDTNKSGFDLTAFWFRSGASTDIVAKGQFPLRPSFAFGDITTAGSFMNGLLMALLGREKSGRGTLVSTSLQASGLWCNATNIINTQPQYGEEFPTDRYEPWDPFSDYYCCSDGKWIAVMEKNYPKDRFVFAEIFNLPELVEDPELSTLESMKGHNRLQEVVKKAEAVIAQKPTAYWAELLEKNDIPYDISRHFSDATTDEQALANDCFDEIQYPNGVTTCMPAPPIKFSTYRKKALEKAGLPGSDTAEILEKLGYTKEEAKVIFESGAALQS